MPGLVTDELTAEISRGPVEEIVGALRHLGNLVVEGSKGQHGRKTPVAAYAFFAANRKINARIPHGGDILVGDSPRAIGARQSRIIDEILDILDIIVGGDID